jgi:hypothetical protein
MNDVSIPAPVAALPPGSGYLTFGQILDRTFRLGRANLKLLLGIAAVPSAAIFILGAIILGFMAVTLGPQIKAGAATPQVFPAYAGLLFVLIYPLMFALFALYLPAASFAAAQVDWGLPASFSSAYSVALRNFWRYLWLMILPAFYVIVPLMLLGMVVGVGAILLHHSSGIAVMSGSFRPESLFFLIPIAALLYLCVLVYCVWIMLRFSLAFPASVVEDLTAWAALKRSAALTKGGRGRIFLVLLVVYAITYAVSLVLFAVYFVLVALGAGFALLTHVTEGTPPFFALIGLGALGYLVVMVAYTMFAYAAYTTALAVIYHDQRLRKDGPLPAALQPGEAV